MKTLGLALVLVLIGSTADAGSAFEVRINGGVARISFDNHCSRLGCATVSWSERKGRSGARSERTSALTGSAAAEPPAPVWNSAPPSDSAVVPLVVRAVELPASAPPPEVAPIVSTPAAQAPEAAPALAPVEQKVVALAPEPRPAPTPLGEWLVEDGAGRIRIEECGKNLCGVVAAAQNPNDTDRRNPDPALRHRPVVGVPILIDMKPGKGNRWDGQIYNVQNGGTYTAHMTLKNADTLRVEGCAFAGLFCGGQNWTRAN